MINGFIFALALTHVVAINGDFATVPTLIGVLAGSMLHDALSDFL